MFAIKSENISKSYKIRHQNSGARYKTLQEALLNLPRTLFGKTTSSENFQALNDVSFEIQPGERVGIIGRNGAGKSTLLKVLSRITEPTSGRVLINGRVASLLEVGTGFHPELTGRENVFMNGAILGMSRAEIRKKFDEIVAFAEVEQFIDTPVKRYSSGMYVRLAFAVAAHLEPEILLVDEVLAVGDAQFQKKCLGKMEDVSKKDGRTIIFVSHNMLAIENLCNSAIVLTNGNISKQGTISECIKEYMVDKSVSSECDLSSNNNRQGDGSIRFTKIEIVNNNNIVTNTIKTGEDFTFILHYESEFQLPVLKSVVLGIAINDMMGTQLTNLCNAVSDTDQLEIYRKGKFICKISKAPLVSGDYTTNLYCSVNGVLADWLVKICPFSIAIGDFYKTGQNQDRAQCLFLLDYNWKNVENPI